MYFGQKRVGLLNVLEHVYGKCHVEGFGTKREVSKVSDMRFVKEGVVEHIVAQVYPYNSSCSALQTIGVATGTRS